MSGEKYNIEDLTYLMKRLREPEFGCPWDIKQDFSSIVPFTLEECYEVIDSIENQDWPHLSEELGDLLFQIIFYSQLGAEQQLFDFADVVHILVTKLIRRHPHVFPNQTLRSRNQNKLSDAQISDSWDVIKKRERAAKSNQQLRAAKLLDDIPKALPALLRAEKLQRRASSVGFDWDELMPVIEKIEEELAELKAAIASGDEAHIKDEMGDVLFAQVNLARHLKVNPEEALRGTNQKFYRRFSYVEEQVVKSDKSWQQYDLAELDSYWDKAKKRGL